MRWLEFMLSLTLPHNTAPMPRRVRRTLHQTEQMQHHSPEGMGCKKSCCSHNFVCCFHPFQKKRGAKVAKMSQFFCDYLLLVPNGFQVARLCQLKGFWISLLNAAAYRPSIKSCV